MATLDPSLDEIGEPQGNSHRQTLLALEVLVVLLFAYSSSFFGQFLTTGVPIYGSLASVYEFAAVVGKIVPLLFIVWVADGSLEVLGISRPKWATDILVGFGFTAFLVLLYYLPRIVLPYDLFRQLSIPLKPSFLAREARAGAEFWMLIPYILASVVFQELLMRGYFVGRLRTLVGNSWLPMAVSAVLFGIWHMYQGPIGAMGATFMGIVFALYFAKYNRLLPLILAHFLYNTGITVWFYIHYQHLQL